MTDKAAAFLEAFAACGNVSRAAKLAGMSRDAHYKRLARDAQYQAAFETAITRYGEMLVARVRQAVLDAKPATRSPRDFEFGPLPDLEEFMKPLDF